MLIPKWIATLVLAIFALLIVGLIAVSGSRYSLVDSYATKGRAAWRLDRLTGTVWLCNARECREILEGAEPKPKPSK